MPKPTPMPDPTHAPHAPLVMQTLDSPVGVLRLIGCGAALVGVYLPVQATPRAVVPGVLPVLAETAGQLAAYFAGDRTSFELPLAPAGTPFQLQVWAMLRGIPFGETRSYGALAQAIARPSASRAVGMANGRNPLAIIVPCHRVIGMRGELTGYAGGVAAKRWLLDHERRHVSPSTMNGAPQRAFSW